MNIKDFKYTSRSDMATDIKDTLEIVSRTVLEVRLINLEEKVEKLSKDIKILFSIKRNKF